jgi:DNA-directed RNA polymerase specialized sigma24 family protein
VGGVTRATTGSRARALRRARAAQAPAEARRQARQRGVEAALAAYFEAADQAERIRRTAAARAQRILAGAELAAGVHDAEAGRAVWRLRELGEANAEIARMCGTTVAKVRAMAARARVSAGNGAAAGSSAPEAATRPGS